jgi:hypothetical protein
MNFTLVCFQISNPSGSVVAFHVKRRIRPRVYKNSSPKFLVPRPPKSLFPAPLARQQKWAPRGTSRLLPRGKLRPLFEADEAENSLLPDDFRSRACIFFLRGEGGRGPSHFTQAALQTCMRSPLSAGVYRDVYNGVIVSSRSSRGRNKLCIGAGPNVVQTITISWLEVISNGSAVSIIFELFYLHDFDFYTITTS